MKTSKKILSVVLAAVFVLSTFSIMAAALAAAPPYKYLEPENDEWLNMKYSVEQVDAVPATSDSEEYEADGIYAVSMYAKCNTAINNITFPIHWNKEHFAPILLYDGTDLYLGDDDYELYQEEGGSYYKYMFDSGANFVYSLGDYMNNKGMYAANGSTASSKARAACIGLGNSNATPLSITTEYVGRDNPIEESWRQNGLPENVGVMFFNIDDANLVKNAYLNNIDGVNITTDWVLMGKVYFLRNEGVSEDDVVGDEFGVLISNCYIVDGACDKNDKGYCESLAASIDYNPMKNVVANAKIEAVAGPKVDKAADKATQVKFTAEGDGVADAFKLRIKSQITAEDWKTYFANSGTAEATTNAITSVGIVAYQGDKSTFNLADAKDVANGMYVAKYTAATTDYVQKTDDDSAAYFGAIINLKHTTCTYDITYVGFVNYLDENGAKKTIFYNATEDSYVAKVSSNYDAAVNAFLQAQ